MIRRNPRGDLPQIDSEAFVDPTALIIGKVIIGPGVFVGPFAVIRADETTPEGDMEAITIGADSNIQDGVVIHCRAGSAVTIGERSSIAHRAIVHGPCSVGNGVFIGFNAVVYDCQIGDGAVVRHNAVVEHCHLPAGFHVPSCFVLHSDADQATVPRVDPDMRDFSESVVAANNQLAAGYRRIANEL
jgi:carbonic anhydrase/acetyltransferase-like protein (isoleucine patch superfamily)